MLFDFASWLERPKELVSSAYRASCVIVVMGLLGIRVTEAQVPLSARAATAEIRTLLHLNGSESIMAQLGSAMATNIIATLRKTNPGLSTGGEAAVRHVVEGYVRERAKQDQVVNLLIPIYERNLDRDEVERLIRFYRTPAGLELARATPAISFESSRAGQQWAESIVPGLRVKLLDILRKQHLQ